MTQVQAWPINSNTPLTSTNWGDDASLSKRTITENTTGFTYPAAVSWGKSYSPAAGIAWTLRPSVVTSWNDVTWAPELGLFCAVSNGSGLNCAMTSPDGITWTRRTTVTANNWSNLTWAPGLGIFCAVSSGNSSDSRVMTSP